MPPRKSQYLTAEQRARYAAKKAEHQRRKRAAYENRGAQGSLPPMAYTPCRHCAFLRDCRHYLSRNLDPYCWTTSPGRRVFVGMYGDILHPGQQGEERATEEAGAML